MKFNKQALRQQIRQYVLAYLRTKPVPIRSGDPGPARIAHPADRRAAVAVSTAQDTVINNGSNQLQRQLDAAIIDILGRKPGPEAGDFTRAIQAVFGPDPTGRIVFKPLGQDVLREAQIVTPPEQTALPEAQAALFRHVRMLGDAARSTLARLESHGPHNCAADLAEQRAIIDDLIISVVSECGRADGIRSLGLTASLANLKKLVRNLGAAMHHGAGRAASAVPPADRTNFQALSHYVLLIEQSCQSAEPLIKASPSSDSIGVARINLALVAAAKAHGALLREYDTLGFGRVERQSLAATLNRIGRRKQACNQLLTVQDLAGWIEYFLGENGPVFASYGDGRAVIADQADTLFSILARIAIEASAADSPSPLYDLFTDPNVDRALSTLLNRLNDLAWLAENNGGVS